MGIYAGERRDMIFSSRYKENHKEEPQGKVIRKSRKEQP
jgi:hypothetical protein